MISPKYFINRLKDVKITDLLSVVPMAFAWIVSPLFKKKYAHTWLITEERAEARDNGYWFYRSVIKNHPEQQCVYAIDKKSVDYIKVKKLGTVIQYGSFFHWLIYFCCEHNISSQKGGKPNAAMCAFIELNNWYNAHNIFLQHGVIINDLRWLYADRSRFQMFVTSALPEKEFIERKFGYQEGIVQLCGLPRFDNLHDVTIKKNRIVVMPTWRYWFNLKSKEQGNLSNDFMHSHYLRAWKGFLESNKLNEIIERYNLEIIFYPHRNLQNHLQDIKKVVHTKAVLASWEEYDIQDLLKSSSMMVTDYSSVFFDMVYMKKPVLFYQFDLEEFRKGQYGKGYFDYQNNPFGRSYSDLNLLLTELEKIVKNNFKCSQAFLEAHSQYFPYYDSNNSERIYRKIIELNENEN